MSLEYSAKSLKICRVLKVLYGCVMVAHCELRNVTK